MMLPLSGELRVLVIGENPLARAGLAALLGSQSGLNVVGQIAPEPDFPDLLAVYRPDALAWETGWDAQRALELLADVKDAAPPVLVLLADESHAAGALAAGARGLLLQDADAGTLAAALHAIARGLAALDPALVSAALPSPAPQPLSAETLTPRELEVLSLIAEGMPNKQIAVRLGISEHTVKFHVNAVMSKLGVQSRTEAVVRATRMGLIVL